MELISSDPVISFSYHEDSSLLEATWGSCLTAEDYIAAIKNAKTAFDKVAPHNTLWNQQRFFYDIPKELQHWTDTFFNMHAVKSGFKGKVAMVSGANVRQLLPLADMFEEGHAEIPFRFFEHEMQAKSWLQTPLNQQIVPDFPIIDVKDLLNGRTTLSLSIKSEELHEYISLLNRLLKSRTFSVQQAEWFYALTPREKSIFQLVIKGMANKEIANKLFISYETVKTHRKRIYNKLRCSNLTELLKYSLFV